MKALSRNLLAGALLAALPMGGALACTTSAWSNGAATTAVAGNPDAGVARYSGECGLEPAGATPFVVDNSPASETDYRVRFYVYTGTASGSPVIFRATDADNAGGTALVEVTYDTANNQLDFVSGSASGSATVADNRWYSVELYYDAGTGITATVQGSAAASPTNVTFGGAVASGNVNSAALGAIAGGTATDTMKFDEFESTRSTTTPIGRLCRGDATADSAINVFDTVAITRERVNGILATGQPDCNEDGSINVFDTACAVSLRLNSATCG